MTALILVNAGTSLVSSLIGGTVLAVRSEDVPGGGPAAAILRYALG